MCLAVPAKIESITGGDDVLRSAVVDFGGVKRTASLAYVPEATVGDWVIVHVGFALSVLDEEEAQATLADLERLAEIHEEIEAAEAVARKT